MFKVFMLKKFDFEKEKQNIPQVVVMAKIDTHEWALPFRFLFYENLQNRAYNYVLNFLCFGFKIAVFKVY